MMRRWKSVLGMLSVGFYFALFSLELFAFVAPDMISGGSSLVAKPRTLRPETAVQSQFFSFSTNSILQNAEVRRDVKSGAIRVVSGRLSDEELETLRDGVEIDGERLKFSDIQFFGGTNRNNWYHVVLMDGKNREVRNLFEYVGLSVSRLKRVRFGPLVLPSSLKVGQHLVLSEEDTEALCVLFGIDYKSGVSSKKRNNEKSSKSLLIPYPELNF